jgi:hypothetical protein
MTCSKTQFPIVIGGDHSIAIGTWSGVTESHNVKVLYSSIPEDEIIFIFLGSFSKLTK